VRRLTQPTISFPASAEEINREMLTPPSQAATDDADSDSMRVKMAYAEENKGASFGVKNGEAANEQRRGFEEAIKRVQDER